MYTENDDKTGSGERTCFILLLRNLYTATYKVNEQCLESGITLFV